MRFAEVTQEVVVDRPQTVKYVCSDVHDDLSWGLWSCPDSMSSHRQDLGLAPGRRRGRPVPCSHCARPISLLCHCARGRVEL